MLLSGSLLAFMKELDMKPDDSWKRNTILVIFNLCTFAWKDQNRQKMADTEESDDALKPHTREVCEQGDTVKVIY